MMADDQVDDALDRRLNYVLTVLNIASAVFVLGYMTVAIDEMTGGALRREWERRRDLWREHRKREAWIATEARRVQFEAWLALQEGAANE